MNCDQTSEYLPWLLNGTLDAGERRAVEEHLRSCAACRQALAETRLAWEVFDQHLPSEQLVAYAWGDPGVDRKEVERHLESCPQCAAELELIGISRRLEGAEDEKVPLLVPAARRRPAPARIWYSSAIAASLVGLIAATGWMESSRRLHSLEEAYGARRGNAPSAPAALRGAPAPATALRQARDRADELARQNDRLRRDVATMQEDQKNVQRQISQLEQSAAGGSGGKQLDIVGNGATASPPPLQSVERGTLTAAAEKLPLAAPYTVLTFVSSHAEGYDRYEIAILDAAGKEIRRIRDLHPEPSGSQFVLLVPKGALASGSYVLQLYGLRDGQRVPLDSYAIRVA